MTEQTEVRRVGEVASERIGLQGNKVLIKQLVGREFIVHRIIEMSGDKGPYLGVQITGNGKECFFFTAHKVVMQKLLECDGEFPLLATIKRVMREDGSFHYYDIE